MLSRILTSALFAGFFAGLIAAGMQLVFVQPLLLQAELYESGQAVHFGADAASAELPSGGLDLVRDGLSVLFTALIYTGYALILLAGFAVAAGRGVVITGRQGVIWGIAGFVSFHLAPAFGLPPELPGSLAADVQARQIWWFATAFSTAAALWIFAFVPSRLGWIAGAVLLLLPHVFGAPHPEGFAGPVPPELSALFAARTLGVGMAAWAILGLIAGFVWHREGAEAPNSTAA